MRKTHPIPSPEEYLSINRPRIDMLSSNNNFFYLHLRLCNLIEINFLNLSWVFNTVNLHHILDVALLETDSKLPILSKSECINLTWWGHYYGAVLSTSDLSYLNILRMHREEWNQFWLQAIIKLLLCQRMKLIVQMRFFHDAELTKAIISKWVKCSILI